MKTLKYIPLGGPIGAPDEDGSHAHPGTMGKHFHSGKFTSKNHTHEEPVPKTPGAPTPAPWKVHDNETGTWSITSPPRDGEPFFLAHFFGDEAEANARLAGTAPDLLSELVSLVAHVEELEGPGSDHPRAKLLIAQARGES